jgi:hypothetical protein
MNDPVVHISIDSGHRASYRDLFARLLRMQPSTGRLRGRRFWQLVGAPHVLFATIDDDYAGFIGVAILRALRRRPTTGLFLRPMQCFRTERPIVYPMKRRVFRWLCRLPGLRLVSIIPHETRPELREVTHDWIEDPQMWDLWVDGPPALPDTDLSRRVEAARGGRRVAIFIGSANRSKDFAGFVEMAERDADSVLCVSAGRVAADCAALAARLRDLGMIVEDRFVSDDEILSLYKVADMAWCRYAPDYDQASGVFGRALQTGVEPLVRPGSVVDQMRARAVDPATAARRSLALLAGPGRS